MGPKLRQMRTTTRDVGEEYVEVQGALAGEDPGGAQEHRAGELSRAESKGSADAAGRLPAAPKEI